MTGLIQVVKDKLPYLAEAIQTFVDAGEAETKYPNDGNTTDPDMYAAKCQGLVVLKDWLEKLISYRNT